MNVLLPALIVMGAAYATDGETVRVDGLPVRLHGVSAPKLDEPLGYAARAFVEALVHNKIVRCTLTDKRSKEAQTSICMVDTTDIGGALVKAGLARDCPHASRGKYGRYRQNLSIGLPEICDLRP